MGFFRVCRHNRDRGPIRRKEPSPAYHPKSRLSPQWRPSGQNMWTQVPAMPGIVRMFRFSKSLQTLAIWRCFWYITPANEQMAKTRLTRSPAPTDCPAQQTAALSCTGKARHFRRRRHRKGKHFFKGWCLPPAPSGRAAGPLSERRRPSLKAAPVRCGRALPACFLPIL